MVYANSYFVVMYMKFYGLSIGIFSEKDRAKFTFEIQFCVELGKLVRKTHKKPIEHSTLKAGTLSTLKYNHLQVIN